MNKREQEVFSQSLKKWLKGDSTTLGELSKLFAEKTFAVVFLLMMALPALPLPTGGVTHVTEIITMLLCLELIIGRQAVWLPKRWLKFNVGKLLKGSAGTKLIKFIAWFEKLPGRRYGAWLTRRVVLPFIGLVVLVFTLAAFAAPPFSGLDTLPALGVVVISLALILDNLLVFLAGVILGIAGITLELAAGTAIYSGLKHFF